MFVKRICAPLFAAMAMLSMSGCLSMTAYVDPALGDLKPADRVQVTDKRPVQFIFAFQTSGAPNSNATSALFKKANDEVVASGLFSEVSSKPVAGGALLSVTINNIPEKDAAGKGIGTGLTFGLAGSVVTDFYVATAKYTAGAGMPTVTAEEKHALHSTVGAAAAPAGMTASKSIDDAVMAITHQLFEHLLNDVAKDPSFKPATKVSERASTLVAG